MNIPLDEVIFFDCITTHPSTGAATDADSTPTFAVYEESTDTDIGIGGNLTKRTSLTGNYRGTFTLSAANGFEVGKWYSIIGSATVNAIAGKAVLKNFRVVAAEATTGVIETNVKNVNNVAATSVTAVNANIGTTQPTNFSGTGATAYVKSDLEQWITVAPLALSSQQVQAIVPDTQKVDVNTIKTQAVTCAAGVTVAAFVGNSTAAIAVTAAGRVDVGLWLGTAPLALSSQQVQAVVPVTQKVDVDTIKTNPVVNGGTITFPTNATLASTTNITAGTIAVVSAVTGLTASDVGAIKTKTDNLPSDPADASDIAALFATVNATLAGIVPVSGTIGATGNDTTHLHLAGLAYADDAINSMLLAIKDVSTGLFYSRWVEDFANTGDLVTVGTLPFTPEASVDLYWILPVRADVTGGSGLDAAGVRAAVGLSSANLDTQLSTIDDFLDTEVAAIKAKTDNLPSDPADASDIASSFTTVNTKLDTIDDFLDTEVAAIKAKTDQLTFTVANSVDATATVSAASIRSAVGLASANLDTQLGTIDDFLDTEVAAIKAKTDLINTATFWLGAFTTNSGSTYASAVAGSVVKEIVDNVAGGGGGATAAQIAAAMFSVDTGLDYAGADANSVVKQIANNAVGSGGAIGPGSVSYTVTVDDGSNPLDGAEVWVSTDSAGLNVVAGTLNTDAMGQVTFLLDAGSYYLWVSHSGYDATNPTAVTVP